MDAATTNSVRTLLVNVARMSLAGDACGAPPDAACVRRVADSLTRARVFLADVVEDWSDSERRALFEMLAGAIAQLQGGCHAEFEIHALHDSTPAAVGARFARWLSEKIKTEQRLAVLRARAKIGRKLAFARS